MKKKYIIIVEIITVLLLGGLLVLALSNKKDNSDTTNNKESSTKNINKTTNNTTVTTELTFYDDEGRELGTGYIDENGEIKMSTIPITLSKVNCNYENNELSDYNYNEEYSFVYSSNNDISSVYHMYIVNFKNEDFFNKYNESNIFDGKTSVIFESSVNLIKKFELRGTVVNPDEIKLTSLDMYLNYLKEKGYKCEVIETKSTQDN